MADMKELLGEDLFTKVQEKLGDKRIDVINDGEWIPKEKFNNVNKEKNDYKAQVSKLDTDLSSLKLKLKDNQDAGDAVEGLRKQISDKEAQLVGIRKNNAITLEAMKYSPHDVKDIVHQLNQEAIVVGEDGTVSGLKEQFETLQEAKPYLFKIEAPKGTGGSVGNPPKVTGGEPKDSKTNFIDVIHSEQAKRR